LQKAPLFYSKVAAPPCRTTSTPSLTGTVLRCAAQDEELANPSYKDLAPWRVAGCALAGLPVDMECCDSPRAGRPSHRSGGAAPSGRIPAGALAHPLRSPHAASAGKKERMHRRRRIHDCADLPSFLEVGCSSGTACHDDRSGCGCGRPLGTNGFSFFKKTILPPVW
jgi:hypothetical protein